VQVDKHNAVTQLKRAQIAAAAAEQNASMQLPQSGQIPPEADTLLPAGVNSSNGSTARKPSVTTAASGPAPGVVKQERQQQNITLPSAARVGVEEGVTVLPLGIVITAPTFPSAYGLVVPRLLRFHIDIDLVIPTADCSSDKNTKAAAGAGAQKRKRGDDEADHVQSEAPATSTSTSGGGFLPPPQPLVSAANAGKSTLPPAPAVYAGLGNQAQKFKRMEAPAGPGAWSMRVSVGARIADEPRPRFQNSDVFGGVRGSSGADRRPDTGSFVGRRAPAAHEQAGFLQHRGQPEDEDLFGCAAQQCCACDCMPLQGSTMITLWVLGAG
jgi:hypothetical protein